MNLDESPKTGLDLYEKKIEILMQKIIMILRLVFIAIMIVYLSACLVGLAAKLIDMSLANETLNYFSNMKIILIDALFTLIVLSIIRTLFIRNGYIYTLTILEVGFVVVIRKLILLEANPNETWLLLILGIISALFFGLVMYAHKSKDDMQEESF